MILNLVALTDSSDSNYKIVGDITAPSSPTHNTIWVNTDTIITGHTFRRDVPSDPYQGLLWIKMFDKNTDSFSISRTHTVMVYPIYAKLYDNGAWKSVTAKRYDTDNYVEWWDGELFTADDMTGGWTFVWNDQASNNPPPTFTGNNIITPGGYATRAVLMTVNMIDLTGWDTLYFDLLPTSSGISGSTVSIGIWERKSPKLSSAVASKSYSVQENWGVEYNAEWMIDVSQFDGLYYVGIGVENDTLADTQILVNSATLL